MRPYGLLALLVAATLMFAGPASAHRRHHHLVPYPAVVVPVAPIDPLSSLVAIPGQILLVPTQVATTAIRSGVAVGNAGIDTGANVAHTVLNTAGGVGVVAVSIPETVIGR